MHFRNASTHTQRTEGLHAEATHFDATARDVKPKHFLKCIYFRF